MQQKYVKQNNSNDILYFSLKLKSDEFKSLHPELTVEVNDTPALSIDELENIVKSRNNSFKMSMLVIDDNEKRRDRRNFIKNKTTGGARNNNSFSISSIV